MQLEATRVTSGRANANENQPELGKLAIGRRMPVAARRGSLASLLLGLSGTSWTRHGDGSERTGSERLERRSSSKSQVDRTTTTNTFEETKTQTNAKRLKAKRTNAKIKTKQLRTLARSSADNNANDKLNCQHSSSELPTSGLTLKPVPLILSIIVALLLSSQQTSQQQDRPSLAATTTSTTTVTFANDFGLASEDASSQPAAQAANQTLDSSQILQAGGDLSQPPLNSDNNKLTGHLRFEFQRYDGWYNNLANSDWGTPNTRLRRKAAPAYSDGVYQMSEEGRPSARLLSQRMMRGEDGQASRRNLTTLFAFFGQVISSEILMASESGCPIEMHRIKIERCDPMYDRECRGGRTMPFYRAAYDPTTGQSPNLPREQLNRVTSWIDGSFIYSTSETWLNTMRSFDGRGTLKMAPRPQQAAATADDEALKRSPGGAGLPSSQVLGDAYLTDLVEALLRDGATGSATVNNQQTAAGSTTASASATTTTTSVNLKDVPMSLFGYPVRNKQRAPLINHMPAHHLQMKKAERMFLLGDPRTNQNPMLLSFGILFYRWHNVLAERIHRQHPDWSDEEIFQRARRLVIASLQNVFLYEFLPVLLDTPPPPPPATSQKQLQRQLGGEQQVGQTTSSLQRTSNNNNSQSVSIESLYVAGQNLNDLQYDQHDLIKPYAGYKPDLHPGISHAFQSSAFRFGHTMIPPGLYLRDDKCRFLKTAQGYKGVRLCSTWWNAEEVVSKVGIEQLLMGAASQVAEREDSVLCNDVRDKLYGPLDFSRRDLAALNIMRGRDNGLADYNTIRQAYRLPRITRWRDINPNLYDQQPGLFEELAKLYQNRLDQVDLYIGGMLESDLERGRPGPLFRRIIKEQFERLRDSDRFWFENTDSGIFSEAEIEEIRQIKLYDIIVNSTLIPDDAIQKNVFQFTHQDPCPQPGQLSSKELQPCYIVKGHSYFKGNEQTYMLVCCTLVLIPIVCALVAYLVVEHQDRKRRKFKAKQEYERNMLANSRSQDAKLAGGHANKSYEHDEDDDDEDDDEDEDSDDVATEDERSEDEHHEHDATHRKRTNKSTGSKLKPKQKSKSKDKEAAAAAAQKCEKIYTKEWLHSNLKRKVKLRFGPEPDETVYVLDGKGQVQRKLDLNQAGSSSVVVELSTSANAGPFGQAYSLIGGPPRHPLQASPTTSSLSLVSGNGGGANSTLSVDSRHQLTTSRRTGGSPPAEPASDLARSDDHHESNQQQHQHARPLTADDLDRPVDHKPMVLIRVARNYDLVLQFASTQHRRKFIFKFNTYLTKINKSMTLYQVQRDIMLANAETKEKRKQRLEQFFREAYALTFGLAGGEPGSGSSSAQSSPSQQHSASQQQQQQQSIAAGQQQPETAKVSSDISMVMRTSLSRQEFAEALGMRSDSLFVRQMFNCIDKDRNGQISFQEFLDLVVKFSRGKPDDKLRIVFDMCDHNGRGLIEKRDLIRMLRSLVDMAKTKSLSEQQVLEMIEGMFKAVGLDQKPLLDYEDFKLIINAHLNVRDTLTSSNQLRPAGSPVAGGDILQESTDQLYGGQHLPLPIGLDMKGAKRNFFTDNSQQQQLAAFGSDQYDLMSASPATTPAHLHHVRRMTIVDTGAKMKPQQQAALADLHRLGKSASFIQRMSNHWKALATELEEHRQDIVYLLMFYVIVVVLFLERFVSYSFLSEHMDLRHVMGFGIAITRGSAASLSFCYAMLLLSMCRNLMTWIRSMSIREYIPLDSHVKFHKIVAMTALIMTVLHTVGHCVNFYHVTQQPVEHLRCLTKEMQFSGESRPTFFYWVFQTVTGTTGLFLWILCSIVYVFAHRQVRQRAYSYFWSTHKLYYLIYALTLLHGSSKLTGSPRFWIFFIIPAILFTIDKIMSLQAKLWQLEIFETECLPSDVIAIKFARPPSFKFLSGQWIRVACTAFRPHEFHAFTITSAPQDDYLSVHVRAQGPWTWKLRNLFDPTNLEYQKMMAKKRRAPGGHELAKHSNWPLHNKLPPRIRIEGPFGGGNQDWCKYEVAVMIGGGIGVTPYASILNDLVYGTSTSRYSSVQYKKVYFIWICPSHRNFEWFIDVLREVEKKDVTQLLEMHIFITQFFHKFDLRTTMLYICENHFQQISNRSLFTGLKAINHFGRPDIAALLQQVQNKHSRVSKVGVFSCGPKPLTKSVTEACEKVNKRRKLPFFLHQYENFS